MAAVDVESVLGECPGRDLKHHGRKLARGVVVLLDAVDDALAGSEVDHPVPRHRKGNCPTLSSVLTLGLDGDLGVAKHVQLPLGKGLLVLLTHLGRRRDGIEHAPLSDPRLRVIGDQLIAVRRDSNARETRCRHQT